MLRYAHADTVTHLESDSVHGERVPITAQQVQSFFSRRATGLRQVTTEDTEATEESEAYDNARTLVLKEVQLCHPIVFDSFNLCDMSRKNRLGDLSVAMLSHRV